MSCADPVEELVSTLRAHLEAAAAGGAFDPEAAQGTLCRLEQATTLLRDVSLGSFGEFEERIDDLSLVSRIGQVFTSIFDLPRLTEALLGVVTETIPCHNSFFLMADRAQELDVVATSGPKPTPSEIELAKAAGALAADVAETLCVTDLDMDSRFRDSNGQTDIRSVLACPLESMGELFGALVLTESERGAFDPNLARILRPVADLCVLAIRHARACAQNLEHQEDLEATVRSRTREVDEARAALSRQERVASMGKLAASIAHEVNNPMSYLVSNIERAGEYNRELCDALPLLIELRELAVELPESDDPRVGRAREIAARATEASPADQLSALVADFAELIAETREGLDRIRRVGDDLRSFAQGTTGVMQAADLNRLCETALNIAKAQAKDDISFEYHPAVLPPVSCQQFQIMQVLLNLLQNAAESIDGEGAVRISTRVAHGWADVEIADDGTGIPPDQLERIFEPFLTTKLKGSGLGLSISRDIVQAHRGSLGVQSSPEGSVFTLRLPVSGPGGASPSAG